MQIKINNIFLILLIIAITVSCNYNERPQNITIKIIETSDVHGQIFPHDFLYDQPANHSLSQIATFVNEERKKKDHAVVLLDNGDMIQGDPTMYYYNFVNTEGKHFAAKVMNYLQYDAATLGNHDIEAGPGVYDKLAGEFDFSWLAANIIHKETGEPYFEPYTVIERSGIKIAVLGLITPSIPNWLPASLWPDMEFLDMIETAKHWVEVIQTKENPDLLIGLFHAGVDYTYSNQTAETPKNENASELVATQVKGFDVIFVGHDHRGWNKQVKNLFGEEVLILGTTSKARDVAVANIELSKTEDGSYEKTIWGDLVKMENYEPDAGFMSLFADNMAAVSAYSSQPVANISTTISSTDALFGDAAFTDLIHNAQMELTGAEVSFAAPFSLSGELKAGQLFVRDMFLLYRYENLIYSMHLTGKEILDHLEFSYDLWIDRMNSSEDNLLKFRKDEKGEIIFSNDRARLENPNYNFDNAEGIIYTVDARKPYGERVSVISFTDGRPFAAGETYLVALNSYRGNGGGNHLTKGAGMSTEELAQRIVTSSELDFRYYLMKWLRQKENINPAANNNWKFIPEKWVETAARNDRGLLTGSQ